MKKLFSVLICAILLLSVMPVFAYAADKVVYVKDGGTGDGSSPDKAVGTIVDAFAAVGDSGTIVVCGKLTLSGNTLGLPKWAGTITITSIYGGTNYITSAAAELYFAGAYRLIFSGAVTMENITFSIPDSILIVANYNKIVMGEGITVNQYSGSKGIYLVGGTQNGVEGEFTARDLNSNIVIKSGAYYLISAFSRQINDNYTGHGRIDVYGGTINLLLAGPVNNGTGASAELNIYGGEIATVGLAGLASNSSVLIKGDTVVNLYGGQINSFDTFGVEGKSILNYTTGAQTGIEILTIGFTDVNKISAPAETTAASTTAASTTTASATTAASTGDSTAPSTLDSAVIMTAAALIALLTVTVISKKRSAHSN